mgnify:CR=1 FL=1
MVGVAAQMFLEQAVHASPTRPFPFSYWNLLGHWMQVREKMGRPTLRLHDLRHSYISNQLAAGTPIWQVNSAACDMDLEGIQNTGGTGPINLSKCVNLQTRINFCSNIAGTPPWDLALTTAPGLPGGLFAPSGVTQHCNPPPSLSLTIFAAGLAFLIWRSESDMVGIGAVGQLRYQQSYQQKCWMQANANGPKQTLRSP